MALVRGYVMACHRLALVLLVIRLCKVIYLDFFKQAGVS